MMDIWVFGNEDFAPDALPLQMIPELKKQLPQYNFITKDPNEEWDMPKKIIIIDTIINIKKVTTFTSLKHFTAPPTTTMHDFDLYMNLKWLSKINKLPPFLIIGIPPNTKKMHAVHQVKKILKQELTSNSPSKNVKHNSYKDHTHE